MRQKKTLFQNPTFKFVGLFFAYVLIAGSLIRLDWVDRRLIDPYTVLISRISGAILNAAGISVETLGTTIRHHSFAVDIRRGCDGIVATAVLVSACLAYPLPWKMRVLGSLLGYSLIFALNLIRVVGLFYAGLNGSSGTFEFFHVYVSQFGVIALAMVFWIPVIGVYTKRWNHDGWRKAGDGRTWRDTHISRNDGPGAARGGDPGAAQDGEALRRTQGGLGQCGEEVILIKKRGKSHACQENPVSPLHLFHRVCPPPESISVANVCAILNGFYPGLSAQS